MIPEDYERGGGRKAPTPHHTTPSHKYKHQGSAALASRLNPKQLFTAPPPTGPSPSHPERRRARPTRRPAQPRTARPPKPTPEARRRRRRLRVHQVRQAHPTASANPASTQTRTRRPPSHWRRRPGRLLKRMPCRPGPRSRRPRPPQPSPLPSLCPARRPLARLIQPQRVHARQS